jgi:phosphatidylglycerophosphate synthase
VATARRELGFLLAVPEKRLLVAIAGRLPSWITPNHLTGLGVVAAAGTAVAYAMSARGPLWLAVASVMLVVHWLGDSLDGTLARVRKTERPRYGYYLDHCVDAFSTSAIGLGIGLSPYVDLTLALGLVIGYLTLSINVYLESQVLDVFRLAYGRIGPTESRLVLVIANTVLAVAAPLSEGSLPAPWVRMAANAGFAILAGAMVIVLTVRFGANLRQLARLEPRRR